MQSDPPSVGSDIASLCGKCKRETWHVVLAMMGGEVVRVQCKGCASQHRYRPPEKGSGARREAGRPPTAGARASSPKASPRQKAVEEPTVQSNLSRPIQAYRVDTAFQVADRVDHPRFGLGVVELVEPGKITVYFPAGRRVLAQAQSGPRLGRPRPLHAEPEDGPPDGAGDEPRPSDPDRHAI